MRCVRLQARDTFQTMGGGIAPLAIATLPRLLRGRVSALLAVALAAGCSGENPVQPGTPPPAAEVVATVEITPDTVRLAVGGTRTLGAVTRAADGRPLPGKPVAWRSDDERIARVDDSGNVTALVAGSVTIFARSGATQGKARIEVAPPPAPAAVAWVRITGGVAELVPGQLVQLGVTLHAADGTPLYGREVRWESSDTLVARIGEDGRAYALRGGTATFTATAEGKAARTTVTVPAWLVYQLDSAGGAPLPVTLAARADTLERSASGMVIRERRVRLAQARLYVSTLDRRYRQLYVLQSWERTITSLNGSTVSEEPKLLDERVVRDEGEVAELDPWTGEPIYRSATFAGHTFRIQSLAGGGRVIRQGIPGEGYAALTLVFRR